MNGNGSPPERYVDVAESGRKFVFFRSAAICAGHGYAPTCGSSEMKANVAGARRSAADARTADSSLRSE